ADIVDLNLVDGPLFAFVGLIVPLPQPTGHDDPHPTLKRLCDVLGHLPPDVAGEEEAVAVLPLTARGVAHPRRRGDPEGRDRLAGSGGTGVPGWEKIFGTPGVCVLCPP